MFRNLRSNLENIWNVHNRSLFHKDKHRLSRCGNTDWTLHVTRAGCSRIGFAHGLVSAHSHIILVGSIMMIMGVAL
jgi:hypothetical protein